MADPLVETKLLLPRPRREVVPRPRLSGLLERAARAPVTVVSAPAGFGKTTLLGTWLATRTNADHDRVVAWVSLGERDRSTTSFWSYVLLALDRALPGSATASLALLHSGQATIEAVLAGLVNEISVHPDEVTLVLDDYHLADGPDIAETMGFLVDHSPPQLRLVISARADPVLPLPRLRARGELVEIRAADLRFTTEEATAYLNDLHGLGLTGDDVGRLESRTEGWAAALQLAALSLRDRRDASAFIAGFAGDDRYVVDYLVDEVLGRQPDDVRRFLLDTAVLDRFTAPLCDAVSPPADGGRRPERQLMLDLLERQNLFLVPLDDHRRWYRYHHLFADVLRAHLLQERPGDVAELHRRASRWYADAGHTEDAVRHALAAGDVDRAAELVELAIPELRRQRRESVILRWVDELPGAVVDRRPVLAIGFVGALMAANEFARVEERLRTVERLASGQETDLVVVDRSEESRLPAAVEIYWAGLALVGGDPARTVERARRAGELAAEGDDLTRSAAAGLMGLAYWSTGDIVEAHRAYTTAAEGLARAGHISDVLGCSLTLADLELTLGRLGDSERTLRRALDLAERHGGEGAGRDAAGATVMRGTADMLVALSRTAWHRNDLAAVADLLRRADGLGEAAGLPQHPYRWRVAMARLRAAEGDWSSALDLLDEAERVYVGDFAPAVHPIHATRARVLTASGDIDGAADWARRYAVGADDELSYLREYEHLTLVRVLLAQHRTGASGGPEALAAANRLLDRLLAAARDGGRIGTLIEVEALRSQAFHAAGDRQAAQAAREHAVRLAEPDGWVRFLVDARPAQQTTAVAAEPRVETLVDPLSDRELVVLRLLASDLDGPGIARELVVSLNTVRTHTRHIYAKLAVNNRRSAVSRAHQLGLLSRPSSR